MENVYTPHAYWELHLPIFYEVEPRSDSWESQIVAYSCDEGPIFETTRHELASDLGVIEKAVEQLLENQGYVYGMCTHPGHHAGTFIFSYFDCIKFFGNFRNISQNIP